MFAQLSEAGLDRIGNVNPQLMRELQGRLRWRNVLLVLIPTLLIQTLIVLQKFAEFPGAKATTNRYCTGPSDSAYGLYRYCEAGVNGFALINWHLVWSDIFRDLSTALPFVMIVGGVFLLIADFSKENQRGTLNFLRMSPASSRSILLGKLLGVPILLYGLFAITLPLHLASGLAAGFPGLSILKYYLAFAATTLCFFSMALWFASLTVKLRGAGPWLGSLTVLLLLLLGAVVYEAEDLFSWSILFNPVQSLHYFNGPSLVQAHSYWPFTGHNASSFHWFGFEVGSWAYLGLVLVNALGLSCWFWTLLERRFQAPGLTPLGKQQSHGLTLFLAVMAMGFCTYGLHRGNVGGYIVGMVVWSLMLIFLLLPTQQNLLDWARYRRQHSKPKATTENATATTSRNLLWDLRRNDNSPLAMALAINLAIIGGVLAATLALFPEPNSTLILLGWFFSAAFLYSCMVMVQLLSLANFQHRDWLSAGALVTVLGGIPLALVMVGLFPGPGTAMVWLLTIAPQTVVFQSGEFTLLFGAATHAAIAGTLTWILTKRLRFLGQSEWKALMDASQQKQLS